MASESVTKSTRSQHDASSPIGMGATDVVGRVVASLYRGDPRDPIFERQLDVPNGGILLALPCLLSMGLLRHAQRYFQLPPGFYRLDSIFLLLAFMALGRVKTIESLRYRSPGEWGNLLGLDRIPDVKTLRQKIKHLADKGAQWASELCRDWMGMHPEAAGVLYVDGHVRVYNGHQTELPRHHVARQKLCLRATVDYWVNAMDGQPFFVLNKAVDPGLLQVLEADIVPRLERDLLLQSDLFNQAETPRFMLVFDREGYSPRFIRKMLKKGIACLSYHKYPGADWDESEFSEKKVCLISGQEVTMQLAERGTLLGRVIWVREIRKRSKNGHQTAIISTDYSKSPADLARAMFARWTQENFFKYMREHYSLDRLVDYTLEDIPESTEVVNPQYREVDGEARKEISKLTRKQCECNEVLLREDIDPDKVGEYEAKKITLLEEVEALEKSVADLKVLRKATPRHILFADLPEEDRFKQLGVESKYLIDAIKMIAYRAETAMVNTLRPGVRRKDDIRSLLRNIYSTEADLIPDYEENTLTVRLHQLANWRSVKSAMELCSELNDSRTIFPGTKLRMVYELVAN